MTLGRPKSKFSLEELGGMFTDNLTQAVTRPTIMGYKPHAKQIKFHSSRAKGRLYIGGNRSGKTVGGIADDVMYLRGKNPYRPIPDAPVRGRIVTVSFTEGIQKIIIPEIKRWILPSDLINGSWEDSYSKSERTLTLANGSFVELMSYDQGLVKFAGTSRHFVHFDEEPPKDIFDECKMRLVDTGGTWAMTMTPVEGMTWVYDEIYEKGLLPESNIEVIVIDTEENPYVSSEEVNEVMADLDVNERKARKEGKFVQLGGLAYRSFRADHVIDPVLPSHDWTHYRSMDHGLNNPTVWLWHAVSPAGLVVTYDEIYDNERVVSSYAEEIHKKEKGKGRKLPDLSIGDPAIAQRNGQTGDSIQTAYAQHGVNIMLGNNDQAIGVEKMNRYLQQNRWLITGNCTMLIRELQRQRWKIYETAKKRHNNPPREELDRKHSHAPDAARYLFSKMPDLYIPPEGTKPRDINGMVAEILASVTVPVGPNYFDNNFKKQLHRQDSEWTVVDENLGGYW